MGDCEEMAEVVKGELAGTGEDPCLLESIPSEKGLGNTEKLRLNVLRRAISTDATRCTFGYWL